MGPDDPPQVTVQKGQTLSGIAKEHGTTVDVLLQANPNIKDPNKINIGDKINLAQIYVLDEVVIIGKREVANSTVENILTIKNNDDSSTDAVKPDFDRANSYTSKFEGGWVNAKNDPGGATNRGIIFSNFKKWAQQDLGVAPTIENLKNYHQSKQKHCTTSIFGKLKTLICSKTEM
jgi:hypothetical protein